MSFHVPINMPLDHNDTQVAPLSSRKVSGCCLISRSNFENTVDT